MSKLWIAALIASALVAPAFAQDAGVGKEYQTTTAAEQDNEWAGPLGSASAGAILFRIANAKKGETYTVKVLAIKENQDTSPMEASCDVQQVGADRKGQSIGAP